MKLPDQMKQVALQMRNRKAEQALELANTFYDKFIDKLWQLAMEGERSCPLPAPPHTDEKLQRAAATALRVRLELEGFRLTKCEVESGAYYYQVSW